MSLKSDATGSTNPLDAYRKKATFDTETLRNLLYGEELVQYKYQVWETLGNDPLFATPSAELTFDQKRELTFQRAKRLYEYDFLSEDVFLTYPMKICALQMALQSLDGSLLPTYTLNTEVRVQLGGGGRGGGGG